MTMMKCLSFLQKGKQNLGVFKRWSVRCSPESGAVADAEAGACLLLFSSVIIVAMNSLNQQYEQKVRPCIDLIDSLRSLGVERDLALPAIAVIGDQSSGKSSVLEALSGVALPRGSGEESQRITS